MVPAGAWQPPNSRNGRRDQNVEEWVPRRRISSKLVHQSGDGRFELLLKSLQLLRLAVEIVVAEIRTALHLGERELVQQPLHEQGAEFDRQRPAFVNALSD